MSKRLYSEANQAGANAIAEDGRWLMGVPAIVADNQDPEQQHRVRVVIPSIDEDLIFDEWARQMVFCLGNGYGSAFIPPQGSEVVLFGQLGQKFNLFYASLYNEDFLMPENFSDEMTVGIHAPGNLKFIAEQTANIIAHDYEEIIGQSAQLSAMNIESNAADSNKITGNSIQLEGATVTINGDGSIDINGGNVTIDGDSVKIHGRTVLQTGPPI